MSYIGRLIEQSGLVFAGRPQSQVTEIEFVDQPVDGIEEINLEFPAPSPTLSDMPTHLAEPAAQPEVIIDRTEPASAPESLTTPPIPFDPLSVTITPDPKVADLPQTEILKADSPASESVEQEVQQETDTPAQVTPQETLRGVFEWVALNNTETTPPLQQSAIDVVANLPADTHPEDTPDTVNPEVPPARKISITRPELTPNPSPQYVESSALPPAIVREESQPEPQEERVEITIGAINITMEAPPRPAAAPVLPTAPTLDSPTLQQPRRVAGPTANRLRRRFIRV